MHAELRTRLIETFRWIDPGPQSGHLVSDVSAWWRDPLVLGALGPALAALHAPQRPTVVVAPEVTGLLLGPLVATALGAGFLPAYKDSGERRIAEPTTWARTGVDYRGRSIALGVRDRHLKRDDRVLVVDDWVATGAQVRALYEVAAARGAEVIGAAAIVADCDRSIATELRLRSLLRGADLTP